MADLPPLVDADEDAPTEQPAARGDSDDEDFDDVVEEEASSKCLFCLAVFPSSVSTFDHVKTEHNFDFNAYRREKGLDFYQCIRLLNFLRTLDGKPNSEILPSLEQELSKSPSLWQNDDFLRPVLEEDPLLYSFDDDDEDVSPSPAAPEEETKTPAKTAAEYEEEIAQLRERINRMSQSFNRLASEDDDDSVLSSSSSSSFVPPWGSRGNRGRGKLDKGKDSGYFAGYSGLDIHEEMLKDRVRTLAYRDFMMNNKHLFEGKVVLDIGCGTGILSLFAAQAGARLVIGIDLATIIEKSRKVVEDHGFQDRVVLIQGRVEEVELPVPKVDVIISEWMGYMLLYESMLSTVLYARDRWLAPTGVVQPSSAQIFLSALDFNQYRRRQREFWSDVYGFNMARMVEPWPAPVLGGSDVRDPLVEIIDGEAICSEPVMIKDIDIMTVTDAELDFTVPFELKFSRDALFGAFVLHFDVLFARDCQNVITMSTSPFTPPTHWKQSGYLLPVPVAVRADDVVSGDIRLSRNPQHLRLYDIVIEYSINGGAKVIQMYEME
eukprot:TRINITY_DN21985_c0_g2_i1.p1 TRINITY_DN21985_c0_g2~~TRINITY_DN21985_c0_g2_i1.p1  ORF type:complete len:549 (-),score=172.14 TRINITY_DN21985_c0_g2_i1:43-1689(-)